MMFSGENDDLLTFIDDTVRLFIRLHAGGYAAGAQNADRQKCQRQLLRLRTVN